VTSTVQQAPVQRPAAALTSAGTRQTRTHPGVVPLLIGIGALATVALWWQDTPSINGLGDWLTNAGRVTGLLAGYTMVVLVALMARIPAVERGVGADRLARWHAMGGRYAVSLVVAHALAITWGYSVTAHTTVLAQTRTLLTSYPDVLAATVAGLLLVGVGVTSARAARRRLAYETWYYLHFYTYLAVALAFSHQLATGADFIANPPARWAWGAMYASVAAAIGWYRFVTPVRQGLRHQLRVVSVHPEAAGVVSVVVEGRALSELQAQPGQFFRWRFLSRDLWWVSGPYSLSAPVRNNRMRITVKALGGHSAAVARLRPGTRVLTEGPYGAMTADLRTRRKVLLLAGGVGITPLRALFETIPGHGRDVTLLYRSSRPGEVVFADELEAIAAHRGADLHIVTGSRAALGGDPLSSTALKARIPDLAHHEVFICGPDGMTGAAVSALREAGVPRRRIHHESFDF